jgi:hypothetical protein
MQSLRTVGMAAVLAAATGLAMTSAASAGDEWEPQRPGATNQNATQQVQVVRQGNDQDLVIRVGPHNSGAIDASNVATNAANLSQTNRTSQNAHDNGHHYGAAQRAQNQNATQQVQTLVQWNDQDIVIRVGPHNSGDINAVNDAYNTATLTQSNTTEQRVGNGN